MFEKILDETSRYNAKLVAVSKTKPGEEILRLYDKGQRAFGENRVQELATKQEQLPADIEWHFIGHLQTNKVKFIAPFVSMIHSVESFKLLAEINKQAAKNQRVIQCLLQFHIAAEETKFGLSEDEASEIFQNPEFKNLQNVRIAGVMGMATFTENEAQIRREFVHLKTIFENLKSAYFQNDPAFKEISMGMSNDYKIALEEGSTMIRIGSLIFGERA